MELEGIRTIYDSEVAYVPGAGGGPRALDTKYMLNFSSPKDAEQILALAKQVLPQAQLVGLTTEFTATWNPNTQTLTAGPDQIYAQADTSGGRYMYRTADGYRPVRIQSVADSVDQFVSELVASYMGQAGLKLVGSPQGAKLIWA